MNRSIRRFAAGLAALSLVAAACGSDDDTADAPPADEPTVTEAPADDPGDETADDPEITPAPTEPPDEPAEMRTIRVGVVGAAMQTTFAPYTSIPMELGYYAEEGIELEIQNLGGSAEVVQAVAVGQLDIGVILSPPLYSAINEGADVQAFFNLITTNFAVPHVPVDSPIETTLDMEGTTVGVVSPGAGAIPLIRSMVAREGGDPDSIDFIGVGAGADVAVVVEQGEIDVVGLWDAVFANLEGLGIELRPLSDPFFDNLGFQGPVFGSREAIESDPDLYAGIGRAIAKANVFANANPEAAIRAHWAAFPDTIPTGVDEDTAMTNALRGLEARLASSEPVDGLWGYATDEQIIEFGEVLVEGGGLNEVPDPADLFTDALIDDINDFDPEPIEQQARDYTG